MADTAEGLRLRLRLRDIPFAHNFSGEVVFLKLTTMNTKTLTLATCLALTLGGLFSLHGQDTPRQRGGGGSGSGMRGPGFDSLTQEEKDKLKAAGEKAQADAKVKEAREKMEAAMKDFRQAMQTAEIAADPSVEPILKKLDEAREKAQKEGGGKRPGAEQPK
jgi:hypothetical protein